MKYFLITLIILLAANQLLLAGTPGSFPGEERIIFVYIPLAILIIIFIVFKVIPKVYSLIKSKINNYKNKIL